MGEAFTNGVEIMYGVHCILRVLNPFGKVLLMAKSWPNLAMKINNTVKLTNKILKKEIKISVCTKSYYVIAH